MKKIFLVIPTLQQGGAERVVSELANHFIEKDIDVHVVLLAEASDFYILDDRVRVHRLGFVNKGRFRKVLSELQVFIKLRKLLKKYRPNATLSFMYKYNVLTILAGRFLRLHIFVSDRSNPKMKLSPLLQLLIKLTYRHATGVIAQTLLAQEIIVFNTGVQNIKVIPNPVRHVQLQPQVSRENIILNVGRLIPFKGQEYLIEAFSKLNRSDWKLVILGDGPLRESLERKNIELNLEGRVIMPGSVTNVDEWYAKASIFAFSSISEGFPNALIEAMAAGLPCVSFDCDAGPRDIIEHQVNGVLVELEDVDGLMNNINMLINNPKLAESLAINARSVRDRYNIESIAKEYLDFLLNK